MTAETQQLVIAAVLLLHGLAHLVALGALVAILIGVRSPTGPVPTIWALLRVSTRAGALVGAILWALATAGFLAAAVAFWGLGLSASAWRPLAVGGAMISLLGIAVFTGAWPGSPSKHRSLLNTAIATLVDVIIIAALQFFRWPALELFGR